MYTLPNDKDGRLEVMGRRRWRMTEDKKRKDSYKNWARNQGSEVLEIDICVDFKKNLSAIIELKRYL